MHIEAARADILAFTVSLREIRPQIWSNNPNQRLNREVRRRTAERLPDLPMTGRLVTVSRVELLGLHPVPGYRFTLGA